MNKTKIKLILQRNKYLINIILNKNNGQCWYSAYTVKWKGQLQIVELAIYETCTTTERNVNCSQD